MMDLQPIFAMDFDASLGSLRLGCVPDLPTCIQYGMNSSWVRNNAARQLNSAIDLCNRL